MYRRSQDTYIEPAGHCGELVQSVTIFNGQETGDTRKVFWGEANSSFKSSFELFNG